MANQSTAINIAKNLATEIRHKNIHLKKVILFGSHVQGEPNEWSDIDIALVADEFIGFGYTDVGLFVDILRNKQYNLVETHTFETNYFEQGDPFIAEIIKTGIVIDA